MTRPSSDSLTNLASVTHVVIEHFGWLAAVPLVGVGAFLLNGILLGTGKSRVMQNIHTLLQTGLDLFGVIRFSP